MSIRNQVERLGKALDAVAGECPACSCRQIQLFELNDGDSPPPTPICPACGKPPGRIWAVIIFKPPAVPNDARGVPS